MLGRHERREVEPIVLRFAPTGLSAGYKANVMPGAAEAAVDGRTRPGLTADSFIAEVRAVMGGHFEYEPTLISPLLQTRRDTGLFKTMERAWKRRDPQAHVAPTMMPGATRRPMSCGARRAHLRVFAAQAAARFRRRIARSRA